MFSLLYHPDILAWFKAVVKRNFLTEKTARDNLK